MNRARRRWLAGSLGAAAGTLLLSPPARPQAADEHWLVVGDSRLRVFFGEGGFDMPVADLVDWVRHSAAAVANYYGRFPVPESYVGLFPVDGSAVSNGKAFPFRVPTINVTVGRHADRAALDRDWILVHEMVHLAFPSVPRRHHWIEEGLATYVEPVARAVQGSLDPVGVWRQFVDGMPKGLPAAGDLGIDRTPTWGRTYWGGALFCLLADVEYLRLSDGRRGLREALRGILDAGLDMRSEAELAPTLALADAAVDLAVLAPLYARWRHAAVAVDLPALWASLGVRALEEGVGFDERAPLAELRRHITAPDLPSA